MVNNLFIRLITRCYQQTGSFCPVISDAADEKPRGMIPQFAMRMPAAMKHCCALQQRFVKTGCFKQFYEDGSPPISGIAVLTLNGLFLSRGSALQDRLDQTGRFIGVGWVIEHRLGDVAGIKTFQFV